MTYALLVDDDESLLESIQRTAELAGLELETASTWDEGLSLFQVHSPSLVIADYQLVGSRYGPQLLAEMRSINPSVRLILISAYIDAEDVPKIEDLGVVDRALPKVTPGGIVGELIKEIKAAKARSENPPNWVDYASAYGDASAVSPEALDELDRTLRELRGID